MTQPTRIFDLIQILEERYPWKDDILSYRTNDGWVKYSVSDYRKYSTQIACGLLAKGYKKDDKIIIISPNRPEWNFLEMGCYMARLVFISLYATLSDDDFRYIFNHSDACMICYGTNSLYRKISPVSDGIENNLNYISIDPIDGIESIWDIARLGEENWDKYYPIIENNINTISKDDLATIIYTSGTTGIPKGVMLSHWNLMFNSHAHSKCMPLDHHNRMMSFLPLSHIYERSMIYDYQELGISIYYAEGVGTIARDIAESKSDGFCAVPRFLEKMYSNFEASGKSLKGIQKKIFNLAWDFANKHDYYSKGWLYNLKLSFYDRMVYSKWRNALGTKKLTIVSGGSAIQTRIVRLFCAAKMTIHEGYGLSETSPVIAVNNPMIGVNVFGTAGKPLKGTEVKIAEDGEIMTRGPHVMMGYYKAPELTKEVVDSEGWLHTGDIGYLVNGMYLKITDRKKEIFKTTSGKYIAPQMIEAKINECPHFTNCIVFGSGQKFASAIIVPSEDSLKSIATDKGIEYNDLSDLLKDKTVYSVLNGYIQNINKTLAPYEQIKRPRFVIDEWTPMNGMLSQTLKLRRNAIVNRYSNVIADIYRN